MSDAGVMSGCDTICADSSSLIHQVVELHVVVTENAWARRFALQITLNKGTNHRILEILFEIQNVEGDS